ncbi:hypothetical protein PPYR_02345 [Photinus pyralis]|uniref:Retrotransposon gag domain-containing protein n=1 Tax=Photinus pyralis TaxID=7054 RepID=A0A5N4B700_PHOPY|nr:hypothetical protein PPYR_02345 [Photinus pyralis]
MILRSNSKTSKKIIHVPETEGDETNLNNIENTGTDGAAAVTPENRVRINQIESYQANAPLEMNPFDNNSRQLLLNGRGQEVENGAQDRNHFDLNIIDNYKEGNNYNHADTRGLRRELGRETGAIPKGSDRRVFSNMDYHFDTGMQSYLPSFGRTEKESPMDFLDELELVFDDFGVNEGDRLRSMFRCLKGAAHKWRQVFARDVITYPEFREAFIEEYWGEGAQRQIRYKIDNGVYKRDSHVSMASYFLELAHSAKYLRMQWSDTELVYAVTAHFAPNIEKNYFKYV